MLSNIKSLNKRRIGRITERARIIVSKRCRIRHADQHLVIKKFKFSFFNAKKFAINFICFVFFAVLLQFAEMTKWGQEAIDSGFDYLVRENFKWAILKQNAINQISQELSLIVFEKNIYKESHTKGYWTPRDKLGLTLLRTLERGASVVIVDFYFRNNVPIIVKNDVCYDDNACYISYLKQIINVCKKNKSVVVFPKLHEDEDLSNRNDLKIMLENPDIFKFASFKVETDSYDNHVRRFSLFEYNNDYSPIFSASLTAILNKNYENRIELESEAKVYITGVIPKTRFIENKLAEYLLQKHSNISSRIIFRLLPREIVAREFEEGLDVLRDILWKPLDIIRNDSSLPDFSGQIVLIGSDYRENHDYHSTVFGYIPGSYILANCINMFLTGCMPREQLFINAIMMLSIGCLFSFLYACFKQSFINCLIIVLSIFMPYISLFVFNKYGLFVDVWIPLWGIGVYNTIANIMSENSVLHKIKISKITSFFK